MALELYSGNVVQRFNQGTDMASWISSSGFPGLCYGLSCYWIACQANGLSFWDLMLDERGHVRDSAAQVVIKLQQDMVGRNKTSSSVKDFTDCWLAKHDLEVAGYKFAAVKGPDEVSNLGSRGCGHAMSASDREYSLVHVSPGLSHAMAAWKAPDLSSLRFFDPNSGEVHFSDRGNFVDWVTTYWFRMSYFVNTDWHCYGYKSKL